MKPEARRTAIMDRLVEQGKVDLDDLALRYDVSKMTIHRDLDELEATGLLRKIRGGATIEVSTQFESDFRLRERQGAAEKAQMADAALALIEPGMTVMINDGSMAAVLGARLTQKRPLTVISNNVAIIDALKMENGISMIALGGIYSAKFNAYFGMVTEQSIAGLRADIAFISTPAVSGTEVFHMDEDVVRTKRAMIRAAKRSCLMVNHTRFGHIALHKLGELAEFDTIISDRAPSGDACAALERAGLRLTLASEKETE